MLNALFLAFLLTISFLWTPHPVKASEPTSDTGSSFEATANQSDTNSDPIDEDDSFSVIDGSEPEEGEATPSAVDDDIVSESIEENGSEEADTADQNSETVTDDSSFVPSGADSVDADEPVDNETDSEQVEDELDSELGDASIPALYVSAHVQDIGWQKETRASASAIIGTSGRSLRMEAVRMRLDGISASELRIMAKAHVENEGWHDWADAANTIGSLGKSQRIEAVRIRLEGSKSSEYDIYYRLHVQDIGWMAWAKNGEAAGTSGESKRVEALQIVIVAAGDPAPESKPASDTDVAYRDGAAIAITAHVQNLGWLPPTRNNKIAGTSGRSLRVEAFQARLAAIEYPGSIRYRCHVQDIGWQGWKKDGQTAGTTQRGLRVEAVQFEFSGEAAEHYDMYYRVHVQDIGWMGWTASGGIAGTEGMSLRIEAIQVKLVPNGAKSPVDPSKPSHIAALSVSYTTSPIGKGWLNPVSDGKTSGTTGQATNIEGLRVRLVGSEDSLPGSVVYRTCVSDTWGAWVSNNADSGASGSKKRVEAIQIKLEGEISTMYDVWYRVHSSGYGWLGWTRDGASAGTGGLNSAIEAVQIRLVPKSGSAPGSVNTPFMGGKATSYINKASGARSITTFGGFSLSSGSRQSIQNAINSFSANGADVGFIMMDLATGRGVAYNCDTIFYAASTAKGPYVASVVSSNPSVMSSWGPSIRNILTYSSNEDYHSFRMTFGNEPFITWTQAAGAPTDICGLEYPRYSARTLAKLWIQNQRFFSETSIGRQLATWYQNPQISPIHSALGGAYTTRTKAGWNAGGGKDASNDAGIVYASNGTYVIAIMSNAPDRLHLLQPLARALDGAHSEM